MDEDILDAMAQYATHPKIQERVRAIARAAPETFDDIDFTRLSIEAIALKMTVALVGGMQLPGANNTPPEALLVMNAGVLLNTLELWLKANGWERPNVH